MKSWDYGRMPLKTISSEHVSREPITTCLVEGSAWNVWNV